MLVNGQEAGLGYEALLAQLAGLDSSFPQYLSVKPQYIIPPETHDIHIDAMTKFNNMKLNEALKGFQELEKNIPKNEPNNPWLSATYLNIGLIQQNLGKHKDAIVSFQRQLSHLAFGLCTRQSSNKGILQKLPSRWKLLPKFRLTSPLVFSTIVPYEETRSAAFYLSAVCLLCFGSL